MAEFCKNIESLLNQSRRILEIFNVNATSLVDICREIETEDAYGQPMVVIGYYIVLATVICSFAIFIDIISGIIMKKFWFPCKSFSLNAASLTLIAVAMKLPMDLTSPMSDDFDQVAKLGGLGFMCIMMCNLMPSLSSMDNKSLVANVTGLSILVITIIVDVGIQIKTGVIFNEYFYMTTACFYMGMLLFLLLVLISRAVTIPTLKKCLESKFQTISTRTVIDLYPQGNIISTVEHLRQIVKRYWIMAETTNFQFVVARSPLSSAAAVICAVIMVVHITLLSKTSVRHPTNKSVYKQSATAILNTQTFTLVLGSIAPICRCFTALRFKWFASQKRNHSSVFKVEKYYTQKLSEWKGRPVTSYPLRNVRTQFRDSIFFTTTIYPYTDWSCDGRVYRSSPLLECKNHIISICIGFQKVVVVSCKIIERIAIVIVMFIINCSYYFKSMKAMFTPPTDSSSDDTNEDLSNYVLLLEDHDVQLTKYSYKGISDSMNHWIKEAEMAKHDNLLKLLEKSVSFEGVEMFDSNQVQSILPFELVNSWSLPIVSLTCIAIALPNIHKGTVDNLLRDACDGLIYTHQVEQSLNKASEYVSIRQASSKLWVEMQDKHKWLENTLERIAYEGKTPTQIIKSFAHISEEILNEFNARTLGRPVEKAYLPQNVIAANSMYRIAQTIMYRYESNNLEIIEDELFTRLSGMIADILAACLTNIPRVVIMKCHESSIENLKASVMDAAYVLGDTTELIKRLEILELPNMDPDKMGYIDEWRLNFKQP